MAARFVWDPVKAEANVRKHGVSFETAVLVFSDPFAILVQDRIEEGEERWQTLGMAKGWALLLVAHTIWDADDVEIIRIISARPATAAERRRYEGKAR
jgi:uncharacterized DUF497 family protein